MQKANERKETEKEEKIHSFFSPPFILARVLLPVVLLMMLMLIIKNDVNSADDNEIKVSASLWFCFAFNFTVGFEKI